MLRYPRYVLTPRMAKRLAYGELAVEPALGPVRVAQVRPEPCGDDADGFVSVCWRDEHGPGSAVGRYPAWRSFPVRMPAQADRLLVRQGIDQAVWRGRVISDEIAFLIAVHLHTGGLCALHRFAVDGSVPERVYVELETAARHRRYATAWVEALVQYCKAREDTGPLPQWNGRHLAEAKSRAKEWLAEAGVDVAALARETGGERTGQRERYRGLFGRKRISTEMAARLIDAAFLLGVSAAHGRALVPGLLAWERTGPKSLVAYETRWYLRTEYLHLLYRWEIAWLASGMPIHRRRCCVDSASPHTSWGRLPRSPVARTSGSLTTATSRSSART